MAALVKVAPKPLTKFDHVYCLDGGTGTELDRRGAEMDVKTWCALRGEGARKLLYDIHNDYVDAGAQVIITNTFASSRLLLEDVGLNDAGIREHNTETIKICKRVAVERSTPTQPVYCAGSLSHFFAYKTESLVNFGPTPPHLTKEKFHMAFCEMIGYFEEAKCDLIILEMMLAVDRMTWCLDSCTASRLPIWCGISAREKTNGELCSQYGEEDIPLEQLFQIAVKYRFIEAIGIMHTSANIITKCFTLLRKFWSGPIFAYPDSGYFRLPKWEFVKMEPDVFAQYVRDWAEQGAILVGGCCGTTPDDIETVAKTCMEINGKE